MFDFVREKRRLVQIVLLLIILPFAFFGVDSYRHAGDTDGPASVNGAEITKQEFETALRQQQDRMRQMLGGNYDPAMFEKAEIKQAVLDNLIAQKLLIERAKAARLTVTDQQIAQVIAGIDAFKADGKFDQARYVAALSSQNMTPLSFEARVKEDLVGQQMREAYVKNGYMSNTAAAQVIAINEQQRVVSVAKLSLASFMAQAKVDDAAVKAYYDANAKEFQVPEQARVEYVIFSSGGLLTRTEVKTEEVRKYYDEHQSEFATPEQRQASHILIAVPATAPQAEQDKAKAKAEQLLAQVKKNPAQFAEVAKQHSQDPGSAANGGDLGVFGRGMMVKSFDDAVFALKSGEISGLVKSDYGFHIIKLVAVKSSSATPFDEVKVSVANKMRQQKAADNFAELADKFSNAVYEQSDTLKPAAALAGVAVEQSAWLVKGGAAGDVWTEKMLQAVFSDEVIKSRRNTAAIEVAASTLVAARLLEHKPATVRALKDVQEAIKQKLLREKALDMAVKQGTMLLGQLKQGSKPVLDWSGAQTVSHAQHGELDIALLRQVYQADSAKLPQFVGAESKKDGYLLVRVDAVKEAEKPDEAKRGRYVQQLRQMVGDEMFQAYLTDAKAQAKIKMKLPETATQ
ncbi:MAG: peptidylprolyl isomerase [Gallionellales bacterium RIFOXYB12_FULL_54_9]|nr:MAG: peptidylprolyl isomerase [Gallionellales bacterium RIFOXYB12_FULL_54_9]